MDNKRQKLHPLLRLAVITGVETAVRLHILRGDNLDAQDSGGATPLILAAAKGNQSIVQMLLEAGANPKVTDAKGMKAFDHAKASGHTKITALLEQNDSVAIRQNLGFDANPSAESSDLGIFESIFPEPFENQGASSAIKSNDADKREGLATFGPDLAFNEEFPDELSYEGWQAEDDVVVPIGDDSVIESSVQVYDAISQHKPITGDEDWADIDLYLPERATPLQREGENDAVRSFLLTAIRHGSFTSSSLMEACSNDDGSPNEEAERILYFVTEELGSRHLEWNADEPMEESATFEENLVIDEAINFAQALASGWSDPFRFYSREMKGDLLTAEDEVALGRVIEEAGKEALFALAKCPKAISLLYESAEKVSQMEANPEYFSSGPEPSFEQDPPAIEATLEDVEEPCLNQASLDFLDAVEIVRALDGDPERMSRALSEVRLTRGFLLEMAKRANTDTYGSEVTAALQRQTSARDRMIRSNLRLAFSLAKKHLWSGVALDDLIQEANIGLMNAVDRWDWRRGFRFSTYATWWIRQGVSRAIADKARLIRVPVHIHDSARKFIRERDAIEVQRGRPESIQESSKRTGMSNSKIKLLMSAYDEIESLDELDVESAIPMGELLVDENMPDPAKVGDLLDLRKTLWLLLEGLDNRSRDVIAMRYGLGGEDPMTLEEIGQIYGLTRERIRQIESKAMLRLTHKNRRDILALFMNLEDSFPRLHKTIKPEPQAIIDVHGPKRARRASGNEKSKQIEIGGKDQADSVVSQSSDLPLINHASELGKEALELGLMISDRRQDGGDFIILAPENSLLEVRTFRAKLLASGFHMINQNVFKK